MSKVKLLLDVVTDLRALAGSIQALADELKEGDSAETAQTEKASPALEQKPEAKPVTLEEVRAVLAEKSRDGFTAEVRGLLEKHGAKKLSEIDPSKFPALLADAEAMK